MTRIDSSCDPSDVSSIGEAVEIATNFRDKWFETFELMSQFQAIAATGGGSYAP